LVPGVNVQLTVSTTGGGIPAPCSISITALVKDMSVMLSVQLLLGQSGAPVTGVCGGLVVTRNDTVPFLISESGIACEPVTVTCAGFCPGDGLPPPGLAQLAVGFALAVNWTRTSPLPSPARVPVALSSRP